MSISRKILTISASLILAFNWLDAFAGSAMIAVAGNFTSTAKALAVRFEEQTGHKALISYGSTGKLYAQILHGAPFEVFLSADARHPVLLTEKGKAVPESQFTYARGKVALFSMDRQLIPANSARWETALEEVDKLALANPVTAPYGEAAVEVLKSIGYYQKMQPHLVLGDNVVQTYQFVYTANAGAGFVSLSQIISNDNGSYVVIPESHYTPIEQDAILLNKGAENRAALDFMEFLKSEKAKKIIQASGYSVSREYAFLNE